MITIKTINIFVTKYTIFNFLSTLIFFRRSCNLIIEILRLNKAKFSVLKTDVQVQGFCTDYMAHICAAHHEGINK